VLRGTSLLVWTGLTAAAFLAASPLIRADDPSAPTPPPGTKLVYANVGGKKVPVFVKNQLDMSHIVHRMEDDPLDHQRAFSAANPMANKSFLSGSGSGWDKSAQMKDAYVTRPYAPDQPANSTYTGRTAFPTASIAGGHTVAAYDKNFATKAAHAGQDEAAAAFAAIGSSEQNRTAPIDTREVDTFAAPMANKTFQGPEEDARHKKLTRVGNGQILIQDLPDRPLTIDEVRDLINHGFKANTSEPPPPASKPLNDPDYQPEPLRIEPTESEVPAPRNVKDDDKDDPVPSPGTMAEPPENSQPLPKP